MSSTATCKRCGRLGRRVGQNTDTFTYECHSPENGTYEEKLKWCEQHGGLFNSIRFSKER